MPRHCTICTHPARADINRAIVEGEWSYATLAERYGVSPDAVRWHKKHHLSPLLASRQEVAQADNALARVRALCSQALEALARAEAQGGPPGTLAAIREARDCLDLLASLTQELARPHLAASEWARMRLVIAEAMYDYPEAHIAVLRRLYELEGLNKAGVSGGWEL